MLHPSSQSGCVKYEAIFFLVCLGGIAEQIGFSVEPEHLLIEKKQQIASFSEAMFILRSEGTFTSLLTCLVLVFVDKVEHSFVEQLWLFYIHHVATIGQHFHTTVGQKLCQP